MNREEFEKELEGKTREEIEQELGKVWEEMEVHPISEKERFILEFLNQTFYRDEGFKLFICAMVKIYSHAQNDEKVPFLLIGLHKLSIALFGRSF